MTSVEFAKIVEQICKHLEFLSVKNPNLIAACNTGESFEKCVVDATKETLSALGIPHIVSYTPGSHVFPDIIVEFESGERYGIEVKSSSSPNSKNWKINGNSVLSITTKVTRNLTNTSGQASLTLGTYTEYSMARFGNLPTGNVLH